MSRVDRGTIVGLIIILAGIGFMVYIGALAPDRDLEDLPRPSKGTTGSTIEDDGGMGTGIDWREAVFVTLDRCTQGYGRSYRCRRTRGSSANARWKRWTVIPLPTADESKLNFAQRFTCLDAKTKFEQGKRSHCTAGNSVFWLRPE